MLTLQGNSLFPADNPWNRNIAAAPVAANSATLVGSIGATRSLHPDFGTVFDGGLNGIPINVVSGTQPKINVVIDAYADESDIVPVPIPAGAVIEGDPLPPDQNSGDRHLIVYDADPTHNTAYELFDVHRPSEEADGKWHADSEAVWNMNLNSFRTPGFTSADAAGLPILPGLVRPDEVLDQGVINHALRFTVPTSNAAYVFPASHQAGDDLPNAPRMGERFRLKQSFDISGFPPADRVILQALKDYGMIVADNGSSWFLSGEPSSRWDDDQLHLLTQIAGSNFEAVDLSPLLTGLDQSSGSTSGGTQVTIHGQNFSGNAGQLQVFFGATAASNISIVSDTLLVATAPAHAAGTVDVTVATPYGVTKVAALDRFTFVAGSGATIVGRRLFYNESGTASPLRYDGNNPAINANDDLAIAADKVAYLPGTATATFANVSSYAKGINGIMIDIAGTHGSITASDFVFKVGNNNTPANWATAPAPTSISVRAGAGTSGSDRIEIVWAANAIQKTWLEVTVKGHDTRGGNDTNTGLAASDLFFFGNAKGDTGAGDTATVALVTGGDATQIQSHQSTFAANIPITNLYDVNRDGQTSGADVTIVQTNQTTNTSGLLFISIAAGSGAALPTANPEIAPDDGDEANVASALTMTATSVATSSVPVLPRHGNRRVDETANRAAIVEFFRDLLDENSPRSRTLLLPASPVADLAEPDDALLDALAGAPRKTRAGT